MFPEASFNPIMFGCSFNMSTASDVIFTPVLEGTEYMMIGVVTAFAIFSK